MSKHFTIGVEEEFQLVSRRTGELCSSAETIVEKGKPIFGERIKFEVLQSTAELTTSICPDISTVRRELYSQRALLVQLLREEDLVPISAGTHPTALWEDQKVTNQPRSLELEKELQEVVRSFLIFGFHVHIGIESKELAVSLMNQLRTWIPHLVALSSNSPFWVGRYTGIKSYRSVVWRQIHRGGIPDIFSSWNEFNHYVQALTATRRIDNGRRIWWDIRPHPFFDTIEFRICDMPATIEDSISLAALCQVLVAHYTRLTKHGAEGKVLRRDFIEENKWSAIHLGLDAEVIDFDTYRIQSMRDSIHELLDNLDDTVNDLGCRTEMTYLRKLLDSPYGTGADRQIVIYKQTGDLQKVIQYLIEQTVQTQNPEALY